MAAKTFNFDQNPDGQLPGGIDQQQMKLNVQIKDLPTLECDSCRHKLFQPLFAVKKLSALQSPDGKEKLINVQIFSCANCGRVPKDFGGELLE